MSEEIAVSAAEEDGPTFLADLTWPDIEAHGSALTLLVPVGSTEQHGPHLPLDTDTRIAKALCIAASGQLSRALVAPEVSFGASGEHQAFPGTLSIGTDALTSMLVELTRSALGPFARIIFVNGHGGNAQSVTNAVATATSEGRDVHAFWPRFQSSDSERPTDAHAGYTETSIILAIAPYAVAIDDVEAGPTEPMAELLPRLRADGLRPHAPNGVLGDPEGANADDGWAMLRGALGDLVELITSLDSNDAEPMEA